MKFNILNTIQYIFKFVGDDDDDDSVGKAKYASDNISFPYLCRYYFCLSK